MSKFTEAAAAIVMVPLALAMAVIMWAIPSAISVLIGLAVLDLVGVINLGWW